MDRITRDNFFGQMARTLDLRSTVESAEEAKRRALNSRRSSSRSPRRTVPSTPGSPRTAERPATASPAVRRSPTAGSTLRRDLALSGYASAVTGGGVGSPSAAAAIEQYQSMADTNRLLSQRVEVLEESLAKVAAMFTASLGGEAGAPQFYSVTFGPGHIGLVLAADDAGNIEVAELRDDPETKRPLLAKLSGKIAVGDYVIAINHRVLFRYGAATLEQVAAEFKASPRPVTVLFQRNPAARF